MLRGMLWALTSRMRADICGENVLVTSSDLLRREECPPIKSYGICEVETVDGSALTAQAPRYQVEPAISKCIDGDLGVKVIDFGKKYVPGIHYGVSIPFNYKAPEVIFSSHFSPSADIWSLGCTVLCLRTSNPEAQLTSLKDIRNNHRKVSLRRSIRAQR